MTAAAAYQPGAVIEKAAPQGSLKTGLEQRWAVCKDGQGWLIEYENGLAKWGAPIGALLWEQPEDAASVAKELGGYITLVMLKWQGVYA